MSASTQLLRSPRALIVEDDPLFATVYRETLGHVAPDTEIEVVPNGYAALVYLAHQRPDIILLDLHMPDFSGFEFLDVIKRKQGLHGVPIVVVSSAAAADTARLRAYPDVFVFSKPLRSSLLHKLISQILAPVNPPPDAAHSSERLQRASLEAFVGDDRELQGAIASQFYELTPERIAQLQACVRLQDEAGISFWCHTMIGTSSMMGAQALQQSVLSLKQRIASADWVAIGLAATLVEEELRQTALLFASTFNLHDRHT